MIRYFIILVIFFLGTALLFPQETNAQKNLLEKANESIELLTTNPEKAFQEAKKIEKEAQKINAKEAELRAINIKLGYYKTKNDFENMIVSAKLLSQKAESYKFPTYQAIAKNVLFNAYMFSGLPDKAFPELQQGLEVINKTASKDSLSIITKANLFIAYSNYYLHKGDYKNQLKYLKLSGKEIENLPDGRRKKKLLYTHYANISVAYKYINDLDSAKHYAELSLSKYGNYGNNYEVESISLTLLGEIAMKKADYKKALSYFKDAEKLSGYKTHLNIENLYDNIIQAYQKLEEEDSVKLYQSKRDSLNLNIAENQNKSLHKLLDEKENGDYKKYIYIFGFVLMTICCIMFYIIRKNRILANQEKISRQYLEKVSENPDGADYARLLEMIKKNDPAFIIYFNKAFPEFPSKLRAINPKISSSEAEFCALLKLKIPTKDISKYQFIEPQSVRNKKHTIRKKLNIPKECDIYQFIEEL